MIKKDPLYEKDGLETPDMPTIVKKVKTVEAETNVSNKQYTPSAEELRDGLVPKTT